MVDYSYYEDTFHGEQISEELFERRLRDAKAFLARATFGSIIGYEGEYGQMVRGQFQAFTSEQLEAVKMGLCKLCEVIDSIETAMSTALSGSSSSGNIKSVSSGGESITYGTAENVYQTALKSPAAKTQLCRSALLEYMRPELFAVNPFYAGES